MPVDVLTEIEIDRPPEVVAAYATDPDNATAWYENIESVEWKTPPPLAVGSRIAFVARFLGRRLEYTYEVRELVPGERLVMSTADGPFAMETTYTWARVAGGTRMTLRNRGEPAGFSRLAAPLLARAMRRANRNDLERLKTIIEGSESPLDTTGWVLVELGGEPVAAAVTVDAPYLELEGGRVSGSGGCNRLTGTYETSRDTLRFGPLATTGWRARRRSCGARPRFSPPSRRRVSSSRDRRAAVPRRPSPERSSPHEPESSQGLDATMTSGRPFACQAVASRTGRRRT